MKHALRVLAGAYFAVATINVIVGNSGYDPLQVGLLLYIAAEVVG